MLSHPHTGFERSRLSYRNKQNWLLQSCIRHCGIGREYAYKLAQFNSFMLQRNRTERRRASLFPSINQMADSSCSLYSTSSRWVVEVGRRNGCENDPHEDYTSTETNKPLCGLTYISQFRNYISQHTMCIVICRL